jgi:hypothetical protein
MRVDYVHLKENALRKIAMSASLYGCSRSIRRAKMTVREKLNSMDDNEFAEWLIGFVYLLTKPKKYITPDDKEMLIELLKQEHKSNSI